MSQRLQILLYGAPMPDRAEFWNTNPDADEDPVHEGLYELCHGSRRQRGDVTMTSYDEHPRLIGVCLTSAYDQSTLRITDPLVDDAIREEWAHAKIGAAKVGVDLDEPEIWLCVVEVA